MDAPGAEQPDDKPDDHADADLLERDGEELAERAAQLLPEGQFQEDEEERDGDAVVQTALDVQRLADPDGDLQVVHDHRPQCGVRGRQDGAEESGLHERQSGEEEQGDAGAQGDGQEQADAEQPARKGRLLTKGPEIDPRGVDEEREDQGDLADDGEDLDEQGILGRTGRLRDQEQGRRGKEQARHHEDHLRRDHRSLQAPREEAVSKEQEGKRAEHIRGD